MKLFFYESKSGRNLILDYIGSLSVDEQVDGYSVLKCLGDGKIVETRAKELGKRLGKTFI